MILERIESPADVKRLSRPELDRLAAEIRQTLIRVCAANGGHLAPNLGVVELTIARPLVNSGLERSAPRYDAIEPTFGAIDISLSLRITRKLVFSRPALLIASYARPPVSAPSPITATTVSSLPARSRAVAMPSAAEMDVDAWPAPNASNSDSVRIANPLMPPPWRKVANRLARPVRSLCT